MSNPARPLNGLAAALATVLSFTASALAQTPSSASTAAPAPSVAALETNQTMSVSELAKLKQNPVSGLRQAGLNLTTSPDAAGSGKTEGAYSLQVVWPFRLNDDLRLITYTILPVLQLPDAKGNTTVGLGDTLLNFYVAPAHQSSFVWGFGPAVLLPTRTDSVLGSDRPGLGPSAVLFYEKSQWSAGVVLQNVWSLGGSGNNEVNAFGAQYLLNYNLPKGWYLYSNATITADWTAPADDLWTVPVGGGFGKIFSLGKQPVSASVQAFSNVVRPADSPTWSLNFQFSLLFP